MKAERPASLEWPAPVEWEDLPWQAQSAVAPAAPPRHPTAPWARGAATLLEACAAAAVLDLGAAWYRIAQLRGDVLRTHVARSDRLSLVAARTTLALVVVTAVVFLVWSYRAARDRVRRGPTTNANPVLAVVGWFVPVLNLFAPPATMAALVPEHVRGRRAMVGLWWGLFLAGGLAVVITVNHPASIGGFRSADEHRIVSDICRIAAALIAARLIRTVPTGTDPAPAPPGH